MDVPNLLLHCRSGSHAYGLATTSSDEDFRGVFFMPKLDFYANTGSEQLSDATNDRVYYELGRFVELLIKANPTALELLASPPETVLYRHPIMDRLSISNFLSKACWRSFAGYATTQIKKARGLNKKVHQPMPKQRKAVVDFCYVLTDGKSRPLLEWVNEHNYSLSNLALAKVDHAPGIFALYHDSSGEWAAGISSGIQANEVRLSNVPKSIKCLAYLAFNVDSYSVYCRQHREYWQWVKNRNDKRYFSTLAHGQGYDAKNMMHTIRLLDMAIEIFRDGALNILRPNREFLLNVKAGAYPLDEVLNMAEQRLSQLEQLATTSSLAEAANAEKARHTLAEMREELYE